MSGRFKGTLLLAAMMGAAGSLAGEEAVVLENAAVRATVVPAGGALTSFKLKAGGAELLRGPSLTDFLLLPGRKRLDLAKLVFTPEPEAGGKALRLTALVGDLPELAAPFTALGQLRIAKRYALADGAVLNLDYELTNTGATPITVCLGTRQQLMPDSPKAAICLPTQQGAMLFPAGSKPLALRERTAGFLHGASAAWSAGLEPGKRGLIAWFQPRHLSFLRADTASGATEVGRTTITIEPNGVFRTSGYLMPTGALPRIDGAGAGVVGAWAATPTNADGAPPILRQTLLERQKQSLKKATEKKADDVLVQNRDAALDNLLDDFAEEQQREERGSSRQTPIKVRLDLLSASSRQAKVVFRLRRNPTGDWEELEAKTVQLPAGKPVSATTGFTPKHAGTWVLRADLRQGQETIAAFEKPLVAARRSGFYLPPPPEAEGEVYQGFAGKTWLPSAEIQLPHKVLAKPLAGGPLNILLAIPYWPSRALVELEARLDSRIDCVVAGGYYKQEGNEQANAPEIERVRRLLNQPHEVIVLALVPGGYFPVDVTDEIFRQVEDEGVGLVILYSHNNIDVYAPLLKAMPNEARRVRASRYTRGTYGKGRIVFRGAPQLWMRPTWVGEQEDDYQELARTISWAARGQHAVQAERVGKVAALVRQGKQPIAYRLLLRNSGDRPFDGAIRLTPRLNLVQNYPFYAIPTKAFREFPTWEGAAATATAPLRLPPNGEAEVALQLPPLAAGHYDFDIAITNAQEQVFSWFTHAESVAAEAQLAQITLTGKEAKAQQYAGAADRRDPPFVARHTDTITIDCQVAGGAGELRLRLEGLEPWGRTVFRQTTVVKDGAAQFQQALHSCLHNVLIWKLTLLDAAGPVAERRILCYVHPRPERLPAFELRGYTEARIRPGDAGWDVRVGGEASGHLAWFNVRKSDYGGWVPKAKTVITPATETLVLPKIAEGGPQVANTDPDGVGEMELDEKQLDPQRWMRVPCLNNPEHRKQKMAAVEAAYRGMSLTSPYRGFAVDEFFYCKEGVDQEWRGAFMPARDMNICRCQYCLASFREYAREIFNGDLERLNRTWQTQFADWDKIYPALFSANVEEAPPATSWAHILDHRHFIDRQVAGYLGAIRAAVQRADPGCETGMSGIWKTGIQNGLDFYLLAKECKYNILYRDLDIWADFGSPDSVRWYGYGWQHRRLLGSSAPWAMLFDGLSAIGYYSKQDTPLWRADYTFYPEPEFLFKEMRLLRESGIDRLLVGRRYSDPVALYYNPRDVYLAHLEEWLEDPAQFVKHMWKAGRGHREFTHQVMGSYRQLLGRRSLQPFWVAYAHLEEGGFGSFKTPRLLMLPYAQTLSAKQAETLKTFVRNGGVLLGDVHTGMRGGHGEELPEGRLDEVFGFRRRGELLMRRRLGQDGKRVTIRFGKDFGEPFAMSFPAVGAEDLELTSGQALAEFTLDGGARPAFVVNRYGKGAAIYLNFVPAGYLTVSVGGVEGEVSTEKEMKGLAAKQFRRVFAKVLETAGVESPVVCEEGNSIKRFGQGAHNYIGMNVGLGAAALAAEYHIRLAENKHVYDARDRKYLGLMDRFPVYFDEAKRRLGVLYAALPYRVEGLEPQLDKARLEPGESLSFTVRVLPQEAEAHRHVIAVKVIDPKGNDVRMYALSTATKDGLARASVDTAVSDPVGTWKLQLTDAASGVRQVAEFDLEQ